MFVCLLGCLFVCLNLALRYNKSICVLAAFKYWYHSVTIFKFSNSLYLIDSGLFHRDRASEANEYWWSSWSTCSKTCGAGLRYRFTYCTEASSIPECIAKANRGVASQKMACKVRDCRGKHIFIMPIYILWQW